MAERLADLRSSVGPGGAMPGVRDFASLRQAGLLDDAERFRRYGAYGLVLYTLATSRWGSYLPLGTPPFFTDIVLLGLIAERVAAIATGRARPIGVDPVLGLATVAMVGWSLILIPVGNFGVTAIRDAAPYLYAITVFLVGPPGESRTARAAAGRALTIALVFHAAWVTANTIDPSFWMQMPKIGHDAFLFLPRPDFDGTVCGLLAVISLHRALCGRAPGRNLALASWGVVLVFHTSSRASLLAFFAELLVLLLLSPVRARITTPGRRFVAPVVLAIVLLSIPPAWLAAEGSLPVQRLFSGTSESSGSSGARAKSWRKIATYLEHDPARLVRGVGFGPDFLHDSGGDVELLGGTDEEVRAPHNYIVNTGARLGLIGLLPMFGMLFGGWRLAAKLGRAEPDLSDADVLAIVSVVALPVAATFGVILESPFGAIPYFWALGHLSVRNIQLGAVTPLGARLRASPQPPPALTGPLPQPPSPAPQLTGLLPQPPPPDSAPPAAVPVQPGDNGGSLDLGAALPDEKARLDINSATFEQLWALKLTQTQCARLIARRDDGGGFSSLDELDELPGFPERVLAELKRRSRV
jgi:hypothetical protein